MMDGSSYRVVRRWFLLGLFLAAFAWRVQGLSTQSLWRDEVDAIYFAVRELPATLSMFVQAGQNGVLYFLSLRPWLHLVGASEFALRYPSALFGALTVPLVWQVARRLIPGQTAPPESAPHTGEGGEPPSNARQPRDLESPALQLRRDLPPLLAALFLAVNPYQTWYGQEGKMYALVVALTLLATWWWLQGIGSGGWRPWLAYLITVSIAIYSHLLMVLLIPLHLLWFGIAWPQSRQHWRGYSLTLAGLTLPYLPMLWWQWDLLTTPEKKTGFNFTPLAKMLEALLLDHVRSFSPPTSLVWLAPIFFLGLAGLIMAFVEIGRPAPDIHPALRARQRHLMVATWLIAPIVCLYVVSLRQPLFTPRYLIWIAPAGIMLLALGAQLVWRNTGRLGGPLAAFLVIYVLVFWGHASWQQKTLSIKFDLRGAVTYIAQRRQPEDLLILQIPHMEYAYRYYSGDRSTDPLAGSDARLGRWAGGLWTNHGWPDDQARAQVDHQMRTLTAGARDIWVMRSEVEMWDARHLMDEWLDGHALLVEQAGFHGAEVRHYQLR